MTSNKYITTTLSFLSLVLIVLASCKISYAQDTVSIFFEFGQSYLTHDQQQKLDSIIRIHNLNDLDSVNFIGIADSIGSIQTNKKLSEKRAKTVADYCKQFIAKQTSIAISAIGENASSAQLEKNRRVDVLFYFYPFYLLDKKADTSSVIIPGNKCYTIDYELLHRSIINSNHGKTIIISNIPGINKRDYYYGSKNNGGQFVITKVQWQPLKSWVKRFRKAGGYITSIPESAYNNYKIFEQSSYPCDNCSEDFQHNLKITKEDSCLQSDRVIMENSTFRKNLNSNKWVWIKVPSDYINFSTPYFIGCNKEDTVKWESCGSWLQRLVNPSGVLFLYTRLPRVENTIIGISRIMECCKENHEDSKCDLPITTCEPIVKKFPYKIIVETGTFKYTQQQEFYAGLGLIKEFDKTRLSVITGTNVNTASTNFFYNSFNYEYLFHSFFIYPLYTKKNWNTRIDNKKEKYIGQFYTGTEIKTRSSSAFTNIQQNIHFGVAIISSRKHQRGERLYLQGGVAYNYINPEQKIYPIIQLGINANLFAFKTNE